MSKIASVFPGQGSQAVGMCKNFYDQYAVARHIFEEADDALGFSITKMCFEGPDNELRLTCNTQPAVLTASVACAAVLKQYGIYCDVAAGHSLGEYSALVISEAIAFADAVRIVRQRGQFMQEAVPVGEGGMAAVLGMENDRIVKICNEVATESSGIVQAVNFNCPGQVVIAGATAAVNRVCGALKADGAKRVIQLPVSAPFHSILMQPASKRLAEALAQITIRDAKIPVVTNVTAKKVKFSAEIRESLIKQAASPVLWETSVLNMLADGVDTFIEVGPGKTLTGFTKKIAKGLPALNVEDVESLNKTLEYLIRRGNK